MKIYAFVVTFNRLELLKRVIECLRNQTYKLEKIIVVNNSSTDGTSEWLDQQSDLYVITQDNLGGAGGFHTGVKYCYENGADWTWMMDDDVFPNPNCLEKLLSYKNEVLCMQPYRYFSDNVLVKWQAHYDLKKARIIPVDFSKEINIINNCCFEGCLINREVVKEIGFPDTRFFIAVDDSSYGWRISKQFQIFYVRDARMVRAKKSTDGNNSQMYEYYTLRNRHLLSAVYDELGESKINFVQQTIKMYLIAFIKAICNIDIKRIKFLKHTLLDMINKKTGKSY